MFKLEDGKTYLTRDGRKMEIKQTGGDSFIPVDLKNFKYFTYFTRRFNGCYFVLSTREDSQDIVAEYVEKKPRKSSSPFKKLLTAKNGDVFVLKGERFKVEVSGLFGLFLTSLDRKYDGPYLWIHVRNKENTALFERQELIDLLRSGQYVVN